MLVVVIIYLDIGSETAVSAYRRSVHILTVDIKSLGSAPYDLVAR